LQREQDRLHRLHEDVRGFVAPLQLEYRFCNLAVIWRKAWDDVVVRQPGKEAVLHEESAGVVLLCEVDSFRLEQVFRNLLDNALAACAAPVQVIIRCSETALAGQPALRVAVRDNGPGLMVAQRAKVFVPFYTTKMQGTGLGLAISKR